MRSDQRGSWLLGLLGTAAAQQVPEAVDVALGSGTRTGAMQLACRPVWAVVLNPQCVVHGMCYQSRTPCKLCVVCWCQVVCACMACAAGGGMVAGACPPFLCCMPHQSATHG